MKVERRKKFEEKKHFAEKSHCVFDGFKAGPFEHAKSFFRKMFRRKKNSTFMKNAFYTDSRFFHRNMHVIKKKEIFDSKVFKLQRFSKVFPNVGGNTLFCRGHYSKNLPKS